MFGLLSEQDTAVGIWAQNISFLQSQLVCFGHSHDKLRSGSGVVVSFGIFEPLMFDAKGVEGHGLEAAELGYPNECFAPFAHSFARAILQYVG